MAYTKQTWNTGDTITADKLNHMEDGIANGGVMAVNATYDESTETTTLDKTWQEIHDAIASGTMVIVVAPNEDAAEYWMCYKASYLSLIEKYQALVVISYGQIGTVIPYSTNSADGYPSFTESQGD